MQVENKALHTDKKKGKKGRRKTNDNRPLLTIKSILPVKDDLTVTCDLDSGKATATFDFDCNHDTADDIIRNLVSGKEHTIYRASFSNSNHQIYVNEFFAFASILGHANCHQLHHLLMSTEANGGKCHTHNMM